MKTFVKGNVNIRPSAMKLSKSSTKRKFMINCRSRTFAIL